MMRVLGLAVAALVVGAVVGLFAAVQWMETPHPFHTPNGNTYIISHGEISGPVDL